MASSTSPVLFASNINVFSTTNTSVLSADSVVANSVQFQSGNISGVTTATIQNLNTTGPASLGSTLDVAGKVTCSGLLDAQSIQCVNFSTINFSATGQSSLTATDINATTSTISNLTSSNATLTVISNDVSIPKSTLGTANVQRSEEHTS